MRRIAMALLVLAALLVPFTAAAGPTLGVTPAVWMRSSGTPSATCSATVNNGVFDVSGALNIYQCSNNNGSDVYEWNSLGGGGSGGSVGLTAYTSASGGVAATGGVAPGSSATGDADNASVLNALLSSGITKLIIDQPLGVGSTVLIPSGVELSCTPGNGLIMLASSNATLLMNKTQASSPSSCEANVSGVNSGYVLSNQCDKNIVVSGCILNHNSVQSISNSDHKTGTGGVWVPATMWLGVDNLTIRDTLVYDSGAYNYVFDNVSHVILDNARFCDIPASGTPCAQGTVSTYGTSKNTDGYHFNGPAQYIDIGRAVIGPNSDDGIAFNADDGYESGSTDSNKTASTFPGWTIGPIDHVKVHDITFNNIAQGFRLLSAGQPVDEIDFSGIDGTTISSVSTMSHYILTALGNCSIGRVSFNNLRVIRGTSSSFGEPFDHYVDCVAFGDLSFNNLHVPARLTTYPVFEESSASTISQNNWLGLDIENAIGTQNTSAMIIWQGTTTNAVVDGVNWQDNVSNTGVLLGGTNGPTHLSVGSFTGVRARAQAYTNQPTELVGDLFLPTCSSAQLAYYSAAGGTPGCLGLGGGLSVSGGNLVAGQPSLANASTPVFSPVGGTYGASSVTLTCGVGSPVYAVGSIPSSSTPIAYSGAISVTPPETINAACECPGCNTTLAAATYPTGAAPTFVADDSNSCGSGVSTTCSSNTMTATAGDLFVIQAGAYNSGDTYSFSCIDSNSNSLTGAGLLHITGTNYGGVEYFYIIGETAGSVTFTCTYAAGSSYDSVNTVQYHAGYLTSLYTSVNSISTGGTSWTSPTFNVGAQGLIVMGTYNAGSTTITADSIDSLTTTQRIDPYFYDAFPTGVETGITGGVTGTTSVSWGGQILVFQ